MDMVMAGVEKAYMVVYIPEHLLGSDYEMCHLPDGLLLCQFISGWRRQTMRIAHRFKIHRRELEQPSEEGRYPHTASSSLRRHDGSTQPISGTEFRLLYFDILRCGHSFLPASSAMVLDSCSYGVEVAAA